ncbi:MAG: hypothetical protein B7Y86_02310 [Brevundimonas subvibrioides]|uniref:Uncharacterized protein n=1 Tax=Brevundimonas subvibrioides TaxID=74313 RepID=A0A258HNG4_9CAUL|nr:hypothetical protein [Brevundimonas subvibrioides]OYX58540.1 MAG: hypothetical protein B7Y86_02310 [Brevundimonas subvibrioides]
METLTQTLIEAFKAIRARLTAEERTRVDIASVEAVDPAVASASHWNFDLPAHAADKALGEDATDAMRRALVATWALELPGRAKQAALPGEVMELYPYWMDKMAQFLTGAADTNAAYDPDHWAKDVRMALVLSVPGALTQTIDLSSPMGPGQVVRNGREGHGWSQLVSYVRAQGWKKPWLEVHTESRQLADFNEAGWDRAWATAAAICKTRPELAGMIGSSWFYDPPLETISPRLAYLRLNPLKGGAFIIHQGPAPIHSERASASSPTRKALIESGEYTPSSWLVAWPKSTLIPWAEQRKAAMAMAEAA